MEREEVRNDGLALKRISHPLRMKTSLGDRIEDKAAKEDDLALKPVSRPLRMKTSSVIEWGARLQEKTTSR